MNYTDSNPNGDPPMTPQPFTVDTDKVPGHPIKGPRKKGRGSTNERRALTNTNVKRKLEF